MNIVLLILGSFIINSSLHNSSDNIKNNLSRELNSDIDFENMDYKRGYCDFDFNHFDDSDEMLRKIKLNYHKKRVLDAISRNDLSTLQKIDIIKRDTNIMDEKMGTNILAGDLLDDWDFNIL